jgi:hypothetical protein
MRTPKPVTRIWISVSGPLEPMIVVVVYDLCGTRAHTLLVILR